MTRSTFSFFFEDKKVAKETIIKYGIIANISKDTTFISSLLSIFLIKHNQMIIVKIAQ